MAEVPYTGVPSVAPAPTPPGDYQHIEANPEAFGGGVAKGVQQLGQGVEQAAGNVFNIAEFQGKIRVDDQVNHFITNHNQILYGDPAKSSTGADGAPVVDTGYMGLTGRAALDAREDTLKALEKTRQQGSENLQSEQEKYQYNMATRRLMNETEVRIGSHADQQNKVWASGVNNDQAYLGLQAISRHLTDSPVDKQARLAAFDSVTKARVQEAQIKYGNDPTAAEAARARANVEAVTAWVKGVEGTGDFAAAQKIAENHKDELGTQYEPIVAGLRTKVDQQIGNQISSDHINQAKGVRFGPGAVAGIPANFIAGIKASEGFAARAQWDYKQFTNGYGTRAAHSAEIIDRETADRRFADEITHAANFVDKVNPNLDTGTRAALTSLTYNGGGSWANGRLGQLIRAGDIEGAKQVFQSYTHAGGTVLQGLVDRRNREVGWFGKENVEPSAEPQPAAYQPGTNQSGTNQPGTSTRPLAAGAPIGEAPQGASFQPGAVPQIPEAPTGPVTQPSVPTPTPVNIASSIKPSVFRGILEDPRYIENPRAGQYALADAARQLQAEQIAENQQAGAAKAQNEAAASHFTAELGKMQYSSNPDFIGLDKQVIAAIDNRQIDAKTGHEIRGWIADASGGKINKTYGNGYNELWQAVHADDDDPMKIDDPSQLRPFVGDGVRGITPAGYKQLTADMEEKKTPAGAARAEAKKGFLEDARKKITFTNPELRLVDPKGEERYLKFLAAYNDELKAAHEAKPPIPFWEMFNPDSKHYIGQLVPRFMPSADERFAQSMPDQPAPTSHLWSGVRSYIAGAGPLLSMEQGMPEPQAPQAAPAPAATAPAFDPASVHSLSELQAAFRDKRVSAQEARQIAVARGWKQASAPGPAAVPQPTAQEAPKTPTKMDKAGNRYE
jgi:lysozyme